MRINKKIFLIVIIVVLIINVACKTTKKCDGINHKLSEWQVVSEATCETKGMEQRICVNCQEVIETREIDLLSHTVIVLDSVEATCTSTGLTEGSKCSVCNTIITQQEIIPALGHNYILNSELSNIDILTYECSRCHDTYEIENENKNLCDTSHQESDWLVVTEATCTTTGIEHKVCEICGVELETRQISKTDHTIASDKKVDPTCTTTGLSEGSHCSECNEIITAQEEIPALGHNYVLTETVLSTREEEGYLKYVCSVCGDIYKEVIPILTDYDETKDTVITLIDNSSYIENDNSGVLVDGNTITIIKGGNYTLLGTLTEGSINVSIGEEEEICLNLTGINITSTLTNPIHIITGNKVEISSKSGTKNYVYDKRVLKESEDASGAAIYSEIDLELKGKGELYVESTYNNGIGCKDDIEIKNITVEVKAINNAIKGNDSLTITSGTIKAISTQGDALKTENSDISSKGNQRGTITILDGVIDLYAACDGIDAAYDVIISGGIINIYTDKYSSYSETVTTTSDNTIYLRISSRSGLTTSNQYACLFINTSGATSWKTLTYSSQGQSKYYQTDIPSDAKYIKFYIYNSSQTPQQSTNYLYCTDQLTIPTSFDTYYISSVYSSNKIISGSWTNYTTQSGGGFPGGPGGMQDGNSDKAEYSCKGVKADNTITISNATLVIKSHDDAIHANSDTLLETSVYGIGNITINSGTINITTDDDGIHADNNLNIDGGNIIIEKSYEAYEGNNIYHTGGTSQIRSSDDALNAKSTLNISGGILYLNADGDGIDSNGTITMSGGIVLALGPSNGGNGVIDYDRSFSISGGLLLAIGCSGMNQKPTATTNNVSQSKNISTTTSSYVNVMVNGSILATIKVVKSNQNYCVLAYNSSSYPSASVTVTTSCSQELVNGLYYINK